MLGDSKTKDKEIIFVYNVDSHILNDKNTSNSEDCNLYSLTKWAFGEKKEWKKYTEALPYKSLFLFKNEFAEQYPNIKGVSFPAVFEKSAKGITQIVLPHEISGLGDIDELKRLVSSKI